MRVVIVNPASASGRTEGRWRRIVAALEAGGEPLDVQLTTGPGDAIACTRRALEAGAHRIVVLGGDGTLGEVVAGCIRPDGTGMVRDDVELAIIHQGTGGDLARGLDVPKVEDAAIDVALNGAVRRIDVGVAEFTTRAGVAPHADPQLDGSWLRGFVSTANVGMAAEVVQKVTGRLKRLGNNGSFAVATVGCLARNKPRPITLSTREGLAAQLTIVDLDVCNNRFMGGGMLVAPDSSIDDGMFDVIVIAGAGRARLIRTFPKIYSGRHIDDPLVRVERTAELTVSVPEGADAEGVVLDGELVGSTPATFRVIASALSVRVPLGASSAAVDR